jgi:hypothetical protein
LAEIRQNLASIEQDTGILQDNARELQVWKRKLDSSFSLLLLIAFCTFVSSHAERIVRGKETT